MTVPSSFQSSSTSTSCSCSNSSLPMSPSSTSSPTPSSSKTMTSARTQTHLPITVDNEPIPNKQLNDFMSSSSSSSSSTASTSSSSSSSSSASAPSPLGFKRSDHHDTYLMERNNTTNNQQMTPNTKRRRRTTSIVTFDSTAIIDGIQNHPQPQSLPLHGTSQLADDSAIIFAVNDVATRTAADGNMSSTSSPIPRHVSRNDFLHVEVRTVTQEKDNAAFGTAADTSTTTARIPSTIPMTMTMANPCPYHPSGAMIITPQSSAIFVTTDCTDTNNTKSDHSNDGNNNNGIIIDHHHRNDHDQVGLSVEEHDDEDGVEDERPLLRSSLAPSGEKKFVGNIYCNGDDGPGPIITGDQVPCPPSCAPKHHGKITKTKSSSSTWWWLVRDMFVLQLVVWLSITAWTQYTSKLTLPPPEVPSVPSSRGKNSIVEGMMTPIGTISESANNNNNTIRNYNMWNNTSVKNTRPDGVVQQADEDCIYVPGGGFSGFWFSLGRLQSLKLSYDQQQVDATSDDDRQQVQSQSQQPPKDRFVCYSAGCLGVVASLLDRHSMSELYAMARAIQVEWVEGRLHRYQVVEAFVDALLEGMDDNDDNDNNQSNGWDTIRRRLFIVTTVPTPHGRWDAQMRQPYDVASLKTMLLQTTWIPLAVGSSFTHHGHMDGAFSTLQHPSCRRKVGLAGLLGGSAGNTNGGDNNDDDDDRKKGGGGISDLWTLWSNTLNVNLRKEDVEHLWQMGLDYGV